MGICDAALAQVTRVAALGDSAAVDPVEVCLLLVTTATTDTRSLVMAVTEVFGASGAPAQSFPSVLRAKCVGFPSERCVGIALSWECPSAAHDHADSKAAKRANESEKSAK